MVVRYKYRGRPVQDRGPKDVAWIDQRSIESPQMYGSNSDRRKLAGERYDDKNLLLSASDKSMDESGGAEWVVERREPLRKSML